MFQTTFFSLKAKGGIGVNKSFEKIVFTRNIANVIFSMIAILFTILLLSYRNANSLSNIVLVIMGIYFVISSSVLLFTDFNGQRC